MENGSSGSSVLCGGRIVTPTLSNHCPRHGLPNPGCNGVVRKPRKLVLHFDIRNTILVADVVTNAKVEQALNSYLTGVTWGRDTSDGWVWTSDQPSLTAPSHDCITYYKHLESQLVNEPSDRALLRQQTGDFTQESIGRKFSQYFEEHLRLLEWHLEGDVSDVLTMSGMDGRRYHYILPSFFSLLHHLHKQGRDFTIIIRTYGLDAENVLTCIRHTLLGGHPEFPPIPNLHIDLKPRKIRRTVDGFDVESLQIDSDLCSAASQKKSERDIYQGVTACSGICGYQDDFLHWQQHNYNHHAGKPLWVDLSDTSVQHIFFDDNIRVTEEDSIVDVRLLEAGRETACSLSQQQCTVFEDACLVQTDLLKSTGNRDYFIEKVDMCERNYEQLLNSKLCQFQTADRLC